MLGSWWIGRGIGLVAVLVVAPSCGSQPEEPLLPKEAPPLATPAAPVSRVPDAAALRKKLGPSLSRSREGLEVVETPAGSRRISTNGRFRSAHVATRGADGKKRIDCVTNERELDLVLERGAVR